MGKDRRKDFKRFKASSDHKLPSLVCVICTIERKNLLTARMSSSDIRPLGNFWHRELLWHFLSAVKGEDTTKRFCKEQKVPK